MQLIYWTRYIGQKRTYMDEINANSVVYTTKIIPEKYRNSLNDEKTNIMLMANNQYETMIGVKWKII